MPQRENPSNQDQSETTEQQVSAPSGGESAASVSRKALFVIGGVLGFILLALLTFVGLSFFSGSPTKSRATKDLPYVDGIIMAATDTSLKLQGNDGTSRTFLVRKKDLAALNIQHMQSHAAIGLPTRVLYDKHGKKLFAVAAEDAPLEGMAKPPPPRALPREKFSALKVGAQEGPKSLESAFGPPTIINAEIVDGEERLCVRWKLTGRPVRFQRICFNEAQDTITSIDIQKAGT